MSAEDKKVSFVCTKYFRTSKRR